MSAVPLMREVIDGEEKKLKKAIIFGTLAPVVLYLIFTLVIVGVSGEATSPDAVSGLASFLGNKAVFIGSILGLLSTFTVFVNGSTALREAFEYDFKFKKSHAYILVAVPPYLLFLSGLRNFIEIIGIVGAVVVSLETVLLVFMFLKAKSKGNREPEYSINVPRWLLYLVAAVFSVGLVYSLLVL